MDIPEKCKPCIHRINDYCKANQVKIAIIAVERCTRKKTEKSRKLRRKLRIATANDYKRRGKK